MNFMVKDYEGKEHGPLNEDTLIKWADAGDVTGETPMRNALMAQWKKASDFNFMKDVLARQAALQEKDKGFLEKLGDSKKNKKAPVQSSSFEYKYLPDPATLFQRLAATFFDFALLSIPALALYLTAFSVFYFSDINSNVPVPEPKDEVKTTDSGKQQEQAKEQAKEQEQEQEKIPTLRSFESEANPLIGDNALKGFQAGSFWKNTASGAEFICVSSSDTYARWVDAALYSKTATICVLSFFTIFLLYYGLLLGLYAQTFGMWFWGIFIVKPDLGEVYLLRAFFFTLAMIFTGILSPFLVFLFSSRRAFDDVVSGVIFLKIAGKPKA